MTKVYVGLGGNIGDTAAVLNNALREIQRLPGVSGLHCSAFYRTTPVGGVSQDDYVNAVCVFDTTLPLKTLHAHLKRIEVQLGKFPKPKDHPRVIDLDLLFFGTQGCQDAELTVPHPRWKGRLFVLVPLMDLTDTIEIPTDENENETITLDLVEMFRNFVNVHNEEIRILTHPEIHQVFP